VKIIGFPPVGRARFAVPRIVVIDRIIPVHFAIAALTRRIAVAIAVFAIVVAIVVRPGILAAQLIAASFARGELLRIAILTIIVAVMFRRFVACDFTAAMVASGVQFVVAIIAIDVAGRIGNGVFDDFAAIAAYNPSGGTIGAILGIAKMSGCLFAAFFAAFGAYRETSSHDAIP
jgi:hypothetical protein